MKNFLLALVLFTAIVSCDEKINDKDFKTISFEEAVPAEDVKGLFTQLDSTVTGITFANVITETDEMNINLYGYLLSPIG